MFSTVSIHGIWFSYALCLSQVSWHHLSWFLLPCMAAIPVPHGVTCELLLLLPCMAAIPLSHVVLKLNCCWCCYCLAWLLNPCPTWRYMELLLLPCIAAKLPVPHGVTCELLMLFPCMAAIPLSHMVIYVNCWCYCLAWLLYPCPTWCYSWIAAGAAIAWHGC